MKGEYSGIVFDRAMIIPASDIQEPTDTDPNKQEQKRQQILQDLKTNLVDNNKLPDDDTSSYYNSEVSNEAIKHLKHLKHILSYVFLFAKNREVW